MSEVEDRLRTALGVLADEVGPSEDPRAELDRRLAARRRARHRAPVLTAAAAALVVVAVFVPATSGRNGSAPDGTPTGSAAPTTPDDRSRLFELGRFTRDGRSWQALGYLQGSRYCTAVLVPGESPTFRPTCEPVPRWPSGPADLLVQSRELLNGDPADNSGMLANRLVFLADPRVATLSVQRGDGTEVAVTEFDRTAGAVAFLADFGGPHDGFGYTARDAQGRVLESAIT